MNNLSNILAELETSVNKIKTLEADLVTERLAAKTLADQYRAQSTETLKALGIDEEPIITQRPAKSNEALLMSVAKRSIRLSMKGGEKNAAKILADALEATQKVATKKNLGDVPAEIKTAIEDRVKKLVPAEAPAPVVEAPAPVTAKKGKK